LPRVRRLADLAASWSLVVALALVGASAILTAAYLGLTFDRLSPVSLLQYGGPVALRLAVLAWLAVAWARALEPRPRALAAVVLVIVALIVGSDPWLAGAVPDALPGVLPVAALGAWRSPRSARARRALAGLGAALAVLVLALVPHDSVLSANGLGLIAGPPDAERVAPPDDTVNDNYPAVRSVTNHLGYRDVAFDEARWSRGAGSAADDGVRRVLLVGDSYVWGDGIPSNEETLTHLLRCELEARAPGRYLVANAAAVGNGVMGYARAADVFAGRYRVDVVVFGYLGAADFDPLDAQALVDLAPTLPPLVNLVNRLGALQRLHEANVRRADDWKRPVHAERTRARLAEAARHLGGQGARLALIDYTATDDPQHQPEVPPEVARFVLPRELAYPGHRTDWWYERNMHPKPRLNREIATRLAPWLHELLAGDRAR
jgi:hypothetical protein